MIIPEKQRIGQSECKGMGWPWKGPPTIVVRWAVGINWRSARGGYRTFQGSTAKMMTESLILWKNILQNINERLLCLIQAEVIFPVHVIRMNPYLNGFPDHVIDTSRFSGQDISTSVSVEPSIHHIAFTSHIKPSVLKSTSSFAGWRKLETFLCLENLLIKLKEGPSVTTRGICCSCRS